MIIYKTTNLIDGKFYIGKSIKDDPNYLGSGLKLVRAIKKYGRQNFKKEILERCESVEQLNEREKYWIKATNAQKDGYNIALGGNGGDTYTDEMKYALSVSRKNKPRDPSIFVKMVETKKKRKAENPDRYKMTEAHKAKMSKVHKGKVIGERQRAIMREKMKGSKLSEEFIAQQKKDKRGANGSFYGQKHSEETRKKMSEAKKRNPTRPMLGKKLSAEHRKKISESGKGRVWSTEQRKKYTGQGASFYGKNHTPESKKKISDAYKNRTLEQKLEKYIRFYFSRMGKYPSAEIEQKKLNQFLCEEQSNGRI